jgi:hypothetical protein
MALDAFGISVPSRQLRAAALDAQHMYGNGVGTLITALAQVVQQNGLSALDLRDDSGALHKWSLDDLRAQIRQGRPVIVQVRYRSLPGRGGAYYFGDHYILVTGVVGDGFRIAEEDLKLRGEGDVLGVRQSGLPGYRIARSEVHGQLITQARDEALRIMKDDPKLKGERGEALRCLLYLFERDEAIRLLRAG